MERPAFQRIMLGISHEMSNCVPTERSKVNKQPKKTKVKKEPKREGAKMEPMTSCDREHDFALVLAGIKELTSEVEDALFEAGCDDATLSVRRGRFFLTFSRVAPTIKDAILSAIQNVKAAKCGFEVLRVDNCNLVTQSDIARRADIPRQLVHQYIKGERGPGNFPSPACDICEESPLWYWCEVAHWMWENNYIKENVVRDAEYLQVINNVLELRHQQKATPKLAEEILANLGEMPT